MIMQRDPEQIWGRIYLKHENMHYGYQISICYTVGCDSKRLPRLLRHFTPAKLPVSLLVLPGVTGRNPPSHFFPRKRMNQPILSPGKTDWGKTDRYTGIKALGSVPVCAKEVSQKSLHCLAVEAALKVAQ